MTFSGIMDKRLRTIDNILYLRSIVERDGGFVDRMTELAPNVEVLTPVYVNNDIEKALTETEQ